MITLTADEKMLAILREGAVIPAHPLALDRDLVVAIDCPKCGWTSEVYRPRTRVRLAESIFPNCQRSA